MWARGVQVMLVLGDFGFIWPRHNWDNVLDKVSKRLRAKGQILYFVDGNHEDFTALYKFPIGADGLRWVRPNIAHIPRGYRTTLVSGRTLAALGGANSVDFAHRLAGHSWWPDESITEADLETLGTDHADVMIGHDAPCGVPTLDAWLEATNHYWPADGVTYSSAGRRMFHRGFLQVHPELYLGGHYHLHVDDMVQFDTGVQLFICRVAILDMNGSSSAISQAILDVQSLDLQFFARADATVTELTGVETGVWHVGVADAVYVIDLDARTFARRPGPDADTRSTDHPRPLRGVEICRIGEPAFLSVFDGDAPGGFRWQTTGEITRIERMEGAP
jgi:hypothetical protein